MLFTPDNLGDITGLISQGPLYLNGSTNPRVKAALARVKAGTGRMLISIAGDSTTVGQGGGTGAGNLQGAALNRRGATMATALTNLGYPANDQSFSGSSGVNQISGMTPPLYDPRFTYDSSTWAGGSGGYSSSYLRANGGGTGTWNFTPTVARDTDIVHTLAYSGGGTLTPTINGLPPVSGTLVTSGSSTAIKSNILTSVKNTGALTLTPANTTGPIYVVGCYSYDSSVSGIDIVALGQCGAKLSVATAYNFYSGLDLQMLMKPDLAIPSMLLNDINTAGNASGVNADASLLTSWITKMKVTSDLLVMFPWPAGSSYNTYLISYHNMVKSICAQYGVAFFSYWEYYGFKFDAKMAAKFYDGGVHPTAATYAEMGTLEASLIMRL